MTVYSQTLRALLAASQPFPDRPGHRVSSHLLPSASPQELGAAGEAWHSLTNSYLHSVTERGFSVDEGRKRKLFGAAIRIETDTTRLPVMLGSSQEP